MRNSATPSEASKESSSSESSDKALRMEKLKEDRKGLETEKANYSVMLMEVVTVTVFCFMICLLIGALCCLYNSVQRKEHIMVANQEEDGEENGDDENKEDLPITI